MRIAITMCVLCALVGPAQGYFQAEITPDNLVVEGEGNGHDGGAWVESENTGPAWQSQWFYNTQDGNDLEERPSPLDPSETARKKIWPQIMVYPELTGQSHYIEVGLSWTTADYPETGSAGVPPVGSLTPEEEALYIGRQTIFAGYIDEATAVTPMDIAFFRDPPFIVPDFDPEWFAVDIRVDPTEHVNPGNLLVHGRLWHDSIVWGDYDRDADVDVDDIHQHNDFMDIGGGWDYLGDYDFDFDVDRDDLEYLVTEIVGVDMADFDLDGDSDLDDYAILSGAVDANATPAQGRFWYDMNVDDTLDQDDLDYYFTEVLGLSRAADFDDDLDIDADDIAALVANMGNPAYDLDGDADADEDDLIYMIENLVQWSRPGGESGIGTKRGDANLDGLVNATDLAIMKASFGDSGIDWSGANLNVDDVVNGTDLAILKANFGLAAPTGTVPEPVTLGLLGLGGLALLRRKGGYAG
ncbi:MAG TPA: PEP-CTERM sorting domain-containing protein [Phycisphaerae bacterium]|nr:PEP-CTERM sorting domain-containing protein [Phycisphaerae bacterium]HDZ44001.1 PEP-CTERM sorting domain-containing protein [Phycisphaerae bacterium]